jgi:transposase-like protein
MAKNQKKYTQEFKQQLVDLYNTGNYPFPQLSSEYGVAKSTILGWVRNLSPIQISETETISMKEYKALQKKMKELEIENEILKKATAIFAKDR